MTLSAYWLMWALWEWVLIVGALAVAYHWPVLIPVSMLVIGSRQQALGILGHEVTHKTVPIPDWLCNLLCMWPILASVQGYRDFHLPHHRHLGHPHWDPELPLKRRHGHRFDHSRGEKATLILRDLVGLSIREPLTFIGRVWGASTTIKLAYLSGLMAALATIAWWMPLLWLWALLTVFWACFRARTWREHYYRPDGTMETYRKPAKLWERLTYLPHRIYRHWDHHQPGRGRVPCWRLSD